MRVTTSILLAAFFTLLASPRAQAPSTDVAVGVFPFLVGNMNSRVNEIANNCVSHGIDTVYVSAFRATGPSTGDLWITDSAGTWNPGWGPVRPGGAGIDLRALINACHAVNVRVVAVLRCFDNSVQPDNAAHKQYLLDVIGYLVDSFEGNGLPTYDLDGIALDYIRYVGSSGAVAANVTNFVAQIRERIGSLSLHAYLLANRFTFDGPVYNGQFNSYSSVRNSLAGQYGQDWQALAPYLDVLMPMTYTANGSIYNTYALHQAYCRQAAAYARTACQLAGYPGRRVCNVVQTYSSSGQTTTNSTIDASITGSLLGGADGYQSFRYDLLVQNPGWWTPMAQHAVPGCNWPVPVLTANTFRLTVTADSALSRGNEDPNNALQARVDVDGDGQFDTPWVASGTVQGLARHPGLVTSTLQVRDADGHIATTRRRFSTGTIMSVFPGGVSASAGGNVFITYDVGTAGAGHIYLALATLSGTSPGFEWAPGFPVPINIDFLTSSIAGNPNGGLVANGLGLFDAAGRATTTLTLPAGVATPFAGQTVHWGFLALSPFGGPSCVGDNAAMTILP
ncbi:MAG: hypothetical protein NXI31_26190 [bacterium]|nr:hypothetical protein [bacterium]